MTLRTAIGDRLNVLTLKDTCNKMVTAPGVGIEECVQGANFLAVEGAWALGF